MKLSIGLYDWNIIRMLRSTYIEVIVLQWQKIEKIYVWKISFYFSKPFMFRYSNL